MLKWALIFAVIALVAGLLGFTGVAGVAGGVAKFLFIACLIVAAAVLAVALAIGNKLRN